MKLTVALLFATCLLLSLNGTAQNITFKGKDVPLQKIFAVIKQQTGFGVVYNDAVLEKTKVVSVDVIKVSLESFLRQVLEGQGLAYEVENRTIIVSRVGSKRKEIKPSLSNEELSGQVVNEKDEPIAGATVTVQGSKISTVTGTDGSFILKQVGNDAVLMVTSIGYVAKTIRLKGESKIEVRMTVAVKDVEEVIVKGNTGYQVIDKNHPGSFDVVSEELLNRRVGFNIIDRIRDLTPGVSFDNPGDGLLIRGRNSIYSNVSPLIVVDNFQYDGNIDNINPNDIETITILKDAASTAQWGARAGNGVIVITTKRGKTSKPSVSLNTNVTFQSKQDLNNYDLISSKDAVDIEKYLYDNGYYNNAISMPNSEMISPVVQTLEDLRNNKITQSEADALLEKYRKTSFKDDLKKYFYRNSFSQQHSLSISGNTPFVNYYLSGGYDQGLSEFVGASNNRVTLRNNNTFKISKDFQIEAGMTYVQNNSKSGSNSGINTFLYSKKLYPYADLVDNNGTPLRIVNKYSFPYIDTAGEGKLLDWSFRPYEEINNTTSKVKTNDFLINIGAKFRIIPSLNMDIKYQFENQITRNEVEFNSRSFYARDLVNSYYQPSSLIEFPVPTGGIIDNDISEVVSHQGRVQLAFSKKLGEDHELNVISGFEIRDMKTFRTMNRQYGVRERGAGVAANIDFLNEYSIYPSNNLMATIPNVQGKYTYVNRFVSSYINGLYRFRDKYTISVSVREDATNLFGVATNQRGVPLWSAGVAWALSNEKFYALRGVPNLTLRATYGYNGNYSTTASAESIITYETNSSGINFALLENPPNDKLRWEQVRVFNVGFDFETKGNVFSGTIEYYHKNIQDLLAEAPIDPTLYSPSVGYTQNSYYYANVAKMKGKGFEFLLNTKILDRNFKWDNAFLLSYSLNKISQYYLPAPTIVNNYVSAGFNTLIGKPVYSLHSLRWGGLEKETGDPLGFIGAKPSKDYLAIINSKAIDSVLYNGPTQPPFFGSMRNTFQYKSFAFSFIINYKFGGFFRKPNVLSYSDLYRSWSGPKEYENRWQKPGDESHTNVPSQVYIDYPQFTSRDAFYRFSEINAGRSDFIRLSDFSFSFNFGSNRKIKSGFTELKLYSYVSNVNLILWKANKFGIDPLYPLQNRPGVNISIGLNATF